MSKEYTTKRLDEILDNEQMIVVQKLIDQIKSGTTDVKELRVYLRSQKDTLEQRGVVSDYLYYALCYQFGLM